MNIDANGLLEVEAEESRSGAKVKITIDTKNRKNLLIKINIFFIDLYSLQIHLVEMILNDMLNMLKVIQIVELVVLQIEN